MSNSIKTLVASVVAVLFSISLFDALFNLNKVIVPGVSNIYNALGTSISPNLITVVIFDFRGYDTLGESIILLTAGLVVLLVFGRGRMSQNSVILKLIALPIAIFVSCMGIMTILGGHITPGGGFQGGAMITAGVILCILVYGLDKSPINFSHNFVDIVESFGILVYIGLGLVGLFFAGAFLYNVGTDLSGVVPGFVRTIFHYPDVTNAGIVPYLNIVVGLKVFVGLSAIVIAFMGFKKFEEEN